VNPKSKGLEIKLKRIDVERVSNKGNLNLL